MLRLCNKFGLKVKLLLALVVSGGLVAGVLCVMTYRRAAEVAVTRAEHRAEELVKRSAEMFLVSTRKFHDEYQKAQDSPLARKAAVADWTRTIFAVDQAVIADLGESSSRVRLIGDKDVFGFAPLGGANTKIESDFEREAAMRLVKGEALVKSLDQDYLRIAAPLPSQAHRGCAECHFATVEGDRADMTRNVILGSLNAYVPLAESRNEAQSEAVASILGITIGIAAIVLVLYVLLTRTVFRPILRCKESVVALANQDFTRKCPVLSEDEVGQMARAINASIDTTKRAFENTQEKVYFYESILNTIPHPVSVTDNEMRWTFVNKAALDIAQLRKEDVLGKHCSNWGADICNTERCGICMAKATGGKASSYFTQPQFPGMQFKVDATVMLDQNSQPMGHIEVIQDITAESHVKQYREEEFQRMAQNLGELSNGNLDFSTEVGPADQYTGEARAEFVQVGQALDRTVQAVRALVEDANGMATAAIEGNLALRADAARHHGEFRKIIDGVNRMFDSIVTPLRSAAVVLETMANRDFTRTVDAAFQGEYAVLIRNVDEVVRSVRGAITEISDSAAQFNEGSRVIAQSAQALAQGADAEFQRRGDGRVDRRACGIDQCGQGERPGGR